jgi:hypothetical protein
MILTVRVTGYGNRGPLFEGAVDGKIVVEKLYSTTARRC